MIEAQKTKSETKLIMALLCLLTILCSQLVTPLHAQSTVPSGSVQLMDNELKMLTVRYTGERILMHLKIGHERAVVLPEPVTLVDSGTTLPGCDIVIDIDVVGFYPTQAFDRITVRLQGLNTGAFYDLGVRASSNGLLQPIQLVQ